jgi:acyl carrier protein
MNDPIKQRVIDIIARHTRVDPATVVSTATLESLGVASFHGIEITFAIEDSFDINVPLGSCDFTADTVGEMVDAVRAVLTKTRGTVWRSDRRPLAPPAYLRRCTELQDEMDRWLYLEIVP